MRPGNFLGTRRESRRLFRRTPLLIWAITVSIFITLGSDMARSQNQSAPDEGIVLPPDTVAVGRQDATALLVIREYRQATQSGTWIGAKCQGEFIPNAVDASGAPSQAETATLWISGRTKFRLDIQKPSGPSSLRMDGLYGSTKNADGHIHPMDARNAVGGLFSFPALLDSSFPTASTVLIDQGLVGVDGVSMHRITMGEPWPEWTSSSLSQAKTYVVDLYFDTRTNLLIKSATSVVGSRAEPTHYLRVIDYGDYRATSGFNLPYRYSERLSGQLLWTLQLNTIEIQPTLTASDFHF